MEYSFSADGKKLLLSAFFSSIFLSFGILGLTIGECNKVLTIFMVVIGSLISIPVVLFFLACVMLCLGIVYKVISQIIKALCT